MVAEVILEFEGVTTKEYDAVNSELGIDPSTGDGDWPEGLISHAAGLNEDGHLVVTEVWDTLRTSGQVHGGTPCAGARKKVGSRARHRASRGSSW